MDLTNVNEHKNIFWLLNLIHYVLFVLVAALTKKNIAASYLTSFIQVYSPTENAIY